MNRLDRLTATLTQLQSKRWIKATEIAERFGITIRTVYRDIRALEEAGVPILSEAGRGYSLVEGYRLPPVMFTREEALSFIVAEKLLGTIPDRESGAHFRSALYKIKSVLKDTEKELIEEVSGQVTVINNLQPLDQGNGSLHIILEGLSGKSVLEMEYLSFEKEELTVRKIEPVGIYFSFGQWYLIAWCRLREAYRTFRVDRAKSVKPTGEIFHNNHPTLKDYLDRETQKNKLVKVVLSVPLTAQKYLKTQRYNHGFVMEKTSGNQVEMTFMTSSLEGFVRWVLMMADVVEVREPKELQIMMKDLLNKAMERLE
jgi:predicted DNA-binding transcriptional regulator YafY